MTTQYQMYFSALFLSFYRWNWGTERLKKMCPKSHSWYVVAIGFQPGYSDPRAYLFNPHVILTPWSDTSEGCIWERIFRARSLLITSSVQCPLHFIKDLIKIFQLGDVTKDLSWHLWGLWGLLKQWSQPWAVLRGQGEQGSTASELGLGSWALTDGQVWCAPSTQWWLNLWNGAWWDHRCHFYWVWKAFKLPYLNGILLRPS